MLRVPLSNPAIKRTIRPLYANHQATPWGGFLDPNFNITTFAADIYPGTVMSQVATAGVSGDIFTPCTNSAPANKPIGLSALFVAPSLGVNEMTASGTNLFTVWVGNQDSVFEILAPAFDSAGGWAAAKPGDFLTNTNKGLLTTGGTTANSIAELVEVISTTKIVVRLRQVD